MALRAILRLLMKAHGTLTAISIQCTKQRSKCASNVRATIHVYARWQQCKLQLDAHAHAARTRHAYGVADQVLYHTHDT
jgi:hypothetical protein